MTDPRSHSPLGRNLAAALGWWREAGVDQDYADAPQGWLDRETGQDAPDSAPSPAANLPKPAPQPAPGTASPLAAGSAAPPLGGDPAAWPTRLEDFAPWWLSASGPAPSRAAPPVAPRGAQGARLMVVVPEPEEEDRDQLLSGPQGQLLTAMLAAMDIPPAECYFASALPCRVPLADWQDLAARGLGRVLRRHVSLAAPQRVLLFGQSILPLLGHDPAQSPHSLRDFNHESGQTPMLVIRNLAVLLDKPAERARFWRRWLEWTGEST